MITDTTTEGIESELLSSHSFKLAVEQLSRPLKMVHSLQSGSEAYPKKTIPMAI